MAYVAPSTVTTLQTYTSAAHNIIVNDIIDHESRINTVQNAQYALKNVLINGAMQFAQRGTSVTGISGTGIASYYTADRWISQINSAGTTTHAVSADAPTGSGFRNSVRITCTTALTSLSSSSYYQFNQRLEGQTLQHIKKGTSSAQQMTLSFWVKSNKTGTYIAALDDNDNSRYVASSYTISAADTWEQKTITFPADTTGVLDNDNATSLILRFWLAAGTDFTSGSLATTWGANTSANNAVGQTNLVAAANNYWAVTGVQLEPGSVASPYEFLSYDQELLMCQRYYYVHASGNYQPICTGAQDSAGFAYGTFSFPVTMRTTPAFDNITGSGYFNFARNNANTSVTSLTLNYASSTAVEFYGSTSGTAGWGGIWKTANAATRLAVSAEL